MLRDLMPRTMEFIAEPQISATEAATLDDRIGLVLTAIEGETIPGRLLERAAALQEALAEQKQKQTPN